MGSSLQKWGSYSVDEAVKEQEELEKEATGTSFMKLKVGKNQLRILPPVQGEKSPFKVVYQHYVELPNGKNWSFTCPRYMAKQKCQVCQMSDALRKSGNPADMDQSRAIQAKRRVFANVIDRNDEAAGPKVLGFGKSIHQELTNLRKDEDIGGDYTHPVDGFDVIITREGTGAFDTKYTVNLSRKSSPLSDDPDEMDEWYDMMHDLNRFAQLPTDEEIMARLNGEEAPSRANRRRLPPGKSGASARKSTPQKTGKKQQRMAQDDAFDADFDSGDTFDAEFDDDE